MGRFLSTDPIGYYDSINLYQYCGNNPMNFVDPWGLFRFGKRPLNKGKALWIPLGSSNPIDNYFNTELSHEHGFFEDGTGDNIGFGPNGRFSEDPTGKGCRYDKKHYDDNRMGKAIENVEDGKYKLFWPRKIIAKTGLTLCVMNTRGWRRKKTEKNANEF